MPDPQMPDPQNSERREREDFIRKHERFVECLERHGPQFNGNEWSLLATDLGWSEEEVQRYSYEYLSCLSAVDDHNHVKSETQRPTTTEDASTAKHGKPESANEVSWSPSECALFDTLVAVYRGSPDHGSWAESVAASLPSKSTSDVKRRFRELYQNHSKAKR